MRVLAAACAAATGCVSTAELQMPELGAGIEGVVLVVATPDSAELVGVDPSRSFPLAVPDGATILALGYDVPLAAHQLSTGPIELVAEGRPLPAWMTESVAVREGSGWRWTIGPAGAGDLLDGLRIAPFDEAACAARGGCLAGSSACTVPCPDPPSPLPPEPPLDPLIDPVTCAGSTERALATQRGPALCEAPPESSPCPEGQWRFTDECTPVGVACPMGQWPEGLPADGTVLYVAPGGAGDGSRTSPFATIAEAFAAAAPGTVIALSAGEHAIDTVVPAGVTLRGACASRTALLGPDSAPTVAGLAGGLVVRDLTIRGGNPAALLTGSSTLAGVLIAPHAAPGIVAFGVAVVHLDAVVVAGREDIAVSMVGPGLIATARALRVEDARVGGLNVCGGAVVVTEDVLVQNVEAPADRPLSGWGVTVCEGASLTATRTRVEDVQTFGVRVRSASTSATFHETVIRDVSPSGEGDLGIGLTVGSATAEASDLLIVRTRSAGVRIGEGASVRLERVVIRDVEPEGLNGRRGWGVNLESATATVGVALIERASNIAVYVAGGAELTLHDAEIAATRATAPTGLLAADAIHVSSAHAKLERVLATDLAYSGVAFYESRGIIRDLQIRGTRRTAPDDGSGTGLRLGQVDLDAKRVAISGSEAYGLYATSADSLLTLSDLHVAGAASTGALIVSPALATLDRVRVEGSTGAGIEIMRLAIISELDYRISLANVSVLGTLPGMSPLVQPAGVRLSRSARVSMSRFEIEGQSDAGISVEDTAILNASDGSIRGHEVGARVTSSDQPLELLLRRIAYRDNEVAIARYD